MPRASPLNSVALLASPTDDAAGEFYADLYLGLYNEAKGDVTLAREYIRAAAKSPYGKSRDYMHALAVVHKEQRGW